MAIKSKQKHGFFKRWFIIFKNTFTIFMDVRGLKFSASLAYYTVFSLALAIGIGTLLIGATTVFADMQHSINKIWEIKPKPKRGWLKIIMDRLLSSSLVLSLGFLLIVSLIINGLLMVFTDYLNRLLSDLAMILTFIAESLVNLLVIGILFSVIFKFLPDVRIRWRDVLPGSIFTAVLFMVGRFAIGFYIQTTGQGSAYGAAGSLIVLLLWVYYAAAILYIGSSFTRAFAEYRGARIVPADFAVHVVEQEKEVEVQELPEASATGGDSTN